MTTAPDDDARGRHPAGSGIPANPPRGGDAGPRLLSAAHLRARRIYTVTLLATTSAAVLFTILLPVLAHYAPTVAAAVAVWTLAGVAVVAVWMGLCEVARRRARAARRGQR